MQRQWPPFTQLASHTCLLLVLVVSSGLALAGEPHRDGVPLPPGAIARMGTMGWRHGGSVDSVVFAPDGKTLASHGSDGVLRVWDVATGAQRHELADTLHNAQSMAFSADGKRLITASPQVVVRAWDMATGKPLPMETRRAAQCRECILSRDGTMLALTDVEGGLAVWDIPSGQGPRRWRNAEPAERMLAISADRKLVVSGTERAFVLRVWEAATGKERCLLEKPKEKRVFAAALSPDGKTVAAGGYGAIYFWDIATGRELHQLPTQKNLVWALAFAPDGATLASGCSSFGAAVDGNITLWDAATGKRIRELSGHHGGVGCLTFAADGKTLASGGWDHTVRLWDMTTGMERFPGAGHDGAVRCAALAPDGTLLASGSWDGTIRLWDPRNGRELRRLTGHRDPVLSVTFSPDGKTLLSTSADGTLRQWSMPGGNERIAARRAGHAAAYSADGKHVAWAGNAVGATTVTIHLGDADSPSARFKLQGHHHYVGALAFSPDAELLASSGGNEGIIRLWHVPTGRLLRLFKRDRGGMEGIAFSADGRMLAARSSDDTIHLWETDTGREILSVHGGPGESVYRFVFCPSDRLLALGCGAYGMGNRIRLWDLATGKEVRVLEGHKGFIGALCVSADRKLLVSGSGDTTLLAWDLRAIARPPALPAAALGAEALAKLWADLLGTDALRAFRAHWALAAAPKDAVPYLAEQLRRDPAACAPEFIRALDSDDFATRDAAMRELRHIGQPAELELLRALQQPPSLEFKRRVEQLLADLPPGPLPPLTGEILRRVRAIGVLEQIGSTEAVAVLKTLAARPRPGREARAAQAALRRLARRNRDR